ncbi:coiled-coil domain-containing protein 115 isoform X2 [Arachis ipaensis]|uniref:coiled-coil domain-containing protein 115 isoform X2 n=1 Tax=Arachis ipaensis TaxID=130454 RepID=UPI0007AF096E|nr:coiled-coil domain-containing protein 115 isoform X2 [Arachis ipaensis]
MEERHLFPESGGDQEPPQEGVEVENRREVRLQPGAEEKLVLQFMDSLNSYLSLSHSLSSTLGQAWMELASARHSMGTARLNTSLLDLKFHPASTTLKITEYDDAKAWFVLRKWVSSEEVEEDEDSNSTKSSELADDDDVVVRRERAKSLSVFGILIPPKLRAAQMSFERALETLVEMANMRSSFLYSFHQLHQEVEDTKE